MQDNTWREALISKCFACACVFLDYVFPSAIRVGAGRERKLLFVVEDDCCRSDAVISKFCKE